MYLIRHTGCLKDNHAVFYFHFPPCVYSCWDRYYCYRSHHYPCFPSAFSPSSSSFSSCLSSRVSRWSRSSFLPTRLNSIYRLCYIMDIERYTFYFFFFFFQLYLASSIASFKSWNSGETSLWFLGSRNVGSTINALLALLHKPSMSPPICCPIDLNSAIFQWDRETRKELSDLSTTNQRTFEVSLLANQGYTLEYPGPPESCWLRLWRNCNYVWRGCTCPGWNSTVNNNCKL